MPCVTIFDKDGKAIGHACVRGPVRRCRFCKTGIMTKLCDFDVGRGKTCDAPMCEACATPKEPEIDYCPNHAQHEHPQFELF
jgi:hypothetical protein